MMMSLDFHAPDLFDQIAELTDAELDQLPYGIIAMSKDGVVAAYNKTEAQSAGLSPERVIGRHFFTSVAPCTNNYMIAHRFEHEEEMDAVIDYVFTLRMAPTPVELRMLKRPSAERMFLVVKRRR
jgi:photoactive yellow protein